MTAPNVDRDHERLVEEYQAPALRATKGLILAITVVFAAELALALGPLGSLLAPSVHTLAAFGGASRQLVMGEGEWFRLLTLAFVHAGIIHLAFNSFGLWIAGRVLEPMLGTGWFLALFFTGAWAGGLASILINPPNIVGVGASGAIMGLFGFLLAFAFRVPKGPERKAFINGGLSVLIPSLAPALLPILSIGSGFQIDYAAHAGGAAIGMVLAGLSALFWRNIFAPVGFRLVALAIVAASAMALAYGAAVLASQYDEFDFQSRLIPPTEAPAGDAEFRRRAEEFARRFPDDPRARYERAVALIQARDYAGAEREAKRAMELAESHPRSFAREFRDWTRLLVAATQHEQGRLPEARATARPLCGKTETAQIKALMSQHKLCD